MPWGSAAVAAAPMSSANLRWPRGMPSRLIETVPIRLPGGVACGIETPNWTASVRPCHVSDATWSSISSPGMRSSKSSRLPTGTGASRLRKTRRTAAVSSSEAMARASSASLGTCAKTWTRMVLAGVAAGGAKTVHWTSSSRGTSMSAGVASQPSTHLRIARPPITATATRAAPARRGDRGAGGGGGSGSCRGSDAGTTPARAAWRSRLGSVAVSAAPWPPPKNAGSPVLT
jgi:hypothetical protein